MALLWIAYLLLGMIAGWIEKHYWTRANDLHDLLAMILGGEEKAGDLAKILRDEVVVENLVGGYALVFTLLFGVFVLTAYMLSLLVNA